MMGPQSGVSFGCSLYYDCSVIETNYIGGGYMFGSWSVPGFSGGGDTVDKRNWERGRDDACFDKYVSGAAAAGGLLATVGACIVTPVTAGAAALACAGSFIGYTAASVAFTKDAMMCESKYPGEGNW